MEQIKIEKYYRVQVGSFSVKANAINLENKLKKSGFDTSIVQIYGLYKVQIGVFKNKVNSETVLKKAREDGFNAFVTYY
ncbi:MAG: SPOR domain-containing protein [Alphaproteobacteria bacterium]|nr:SPOR domain-containing protein [Alphaproteobacteria bacterium]